MDVVGASSAVGAVADPLGYARLLQRAREAVLSGADGPVPLRPLVSASWRRVQAAGVDPDHHEAPIVYEHREVVSRRAEHPLARVLPLLRSALGRFVFDAMHVLVITDELGRVLWLDGHPAVRRAAEGIRFVEGVLWSETAAGTNAIGTALAVGEPLQMFGPEHFLCAQHLWTCAAAPVRDPDTGGLLGVVDLSGPISTINPLALGLVSTAARLAEGALEHERLARDEKLRETYLERAVRYRHRRSAVVTASGRILLAQPLDWVGGQVRVPEGGGVMTLPDGTEAIAEPLGRDGWLLLAPQRGELAVARPALRLRVLGPDPPAAWLAGRPVHLTARHAEIVALLAWHRDGLSSEQLALELHGERGNPITARAEVSRLRELLGPVLRTRPYRLDAELSADFLDAARHAAAGRFAEALAAYPGPLLPRSDAPGVGEVRDELEGTLRRGVLAAGDPDLLAAWLATASGREDLAAHDRALALLPPGDARAAALRSRLARLRGRFTVPGPPASRGNRSGG